MEIYRKCQEINYLNLKNMYIINKIKIPNKVIVKYSFKSENLIVRDLLLKESSESFFL